MTDVKPYKHILYATNLGTHMRPVFKQAINLARIHHAKITMLHAVAPMGTTGQAILSLWMPEREVQDIEKESMEAVMTNMHERLKKYCEEEDDVIHDKDEIIEKIAVSAGNPADVIKHYAETHGTDLIVIGSHTRSGHSSTMLGSTARAVTLHSQIPVLIIPNRQN